MKKVLITGGAGFIGSHIVDKLLENNFKIVVIDNLSSGNLENLPQESDVKLYQSDIENDDIEFIFKEEKPNFVIHLAAQTSVNYSIQNPCIDANRNIVASIKLLEISKKYNIEKFIAASSAAVYGNPKKLPVEETHDTNPTSQYGLSKLTMEKYIQLSNIPYIIFRFSNAFGPRQRSSKESGVIAIFHEAMKNNKEINIFGNGEQIRDFIYVEDIAKICVKAIQSDIKNEIVNFSTNKGITLNDLFREMSQLYKYNQKPNFQQERVGDIKNSILSNIKAKKLFNEIEFTDLQTGLNCLYNSQN